MTSNETYLADEKVNEMIVNKRKKKIVTFPNLHATLRERREFAAKVRAARAVLGWSQAELARRVGVTQRSINRLEQADVDIRRSTAVAIEGVLKSEGIIFEALPGGGFRMLVSDGERGDPDIGR